MKGIIRGSGERTTWWIDGVQVSKEEFDLRFPPVRTKPGDDAGLCGWKPILSDAMAVHPRQIKEAEEDARKKGVPTEFEGEFGRPLFTSRSHRKAYMKAYGVHDNNGGFGDG